MENESTITIGSNTGENLYATHPAQDSPRPARHGRVAAFAPRAGADTPAPRKTPLVNALAETRHTIPYRPDLNKITKSVLASILLQQMTWLWAKAGCRPFTKFVAPAPSNKSYEQGTSWHEELGFSRSKFERAIRAIGTKVTSGKSKREARKNNLVIYWTDAERLTHWELNEALLEAHLGRIYAAPEVADTEHAGGEHSLGNVESCASDKIVPSEARTDSAQVMQHPAVPRKCRNSTVLKNAPTQTTDSANGRGSSNGRQPQKTHELEALVLENGSGRSSNSLSEHPQTRASEARSSSQEVTTLSGAGESSGRDSRNLKRQEQKPAPRQGRRESSASTATSKKALAVKGADLSPAARETLEAALGRQAELKGQANVPHTRRRLLALKGADETAWISLLSHSTLTARTCVASFAETHAARPPSSAGASLADAGRSKRYDLVRNGSYGQRGAFVEDGVPKGSQPAADDVYTQHGALIKNGCRPTRRDGSYSRDIRLSADGIRYHLLKGERSPDKLGSAFVEDGVDSKIHEGLAGLEKERAQRAGAARRREGFEVLIKTREETEASA